MIAFTTAETDDDLRQILSLQQANLPKNLLKQEIEKEDFVTVEHNFNQLKRLNDTEPHIIAKKNDKLIAYVLAMTRQARTDIPVLIPMFKMFDEINYNHQPIAFYNYIVVGQVCVDKDFRGLKVFDQCYQTYKHYFSHRYDFAITEIATNNSRSISAHKKIGFKEIKKYTDANVEWSIVIWDWNE